MILEKITTKFYKKPRTLFILDGVGALLSAFLLGVVLVRLEHIFGIPSSALYVLAIVPIFFAIFDFYSYRKEHGKLDKFLKGIAIMNLCYCMLSLGLAFFHRQTITSFGWAYIMIEIIIIIVLAIIELKVSKRLLS